MTAPFLAIGVGCRRGVGGEAIAALVTRALAAAARPGDPAVLFTLSDKVGEIGIGEAAARLGLPLVHLPKEALAAVADRVTLRSERVVELFGVPAIAEAAALAGAGPQSRLIVERIAEAGVTVAVALGGKTEETTA